MEKWTEPRTPHTDKLKMFIWVYELLKKNRCIDSFIEFAQVRQDNEKREENNNAVHFKE